ncbi:MAG: redoxin domain-containing protein [Sulfurovum sp.]|nr:redoxin domain-containing protein [Sulfurovum sp.]
MLKISALFLSILFIIFAIFIGWEDKKPDNTPISIENTTEIFTTKAIDDQQDKRFQVEKKRDDTLNDISDDIPKVEMPQQETFIFDENHTVTVSGQKVIFHKSEQPIVIVNIFATWCPPCIGEIAYLNDLQTKHQKELFITGILTHDIIEQSALKTFISKHQINYFISNSTHNDAFANLLVSTLHLPKKFSIPLTVMYIGGEYFTHYEGTVPVEMIEYDIQQAKKQLKPR